MSIQFALKLVQPIESMLKCYKCYSFHYLNNSTELYCLRAHTNCCYFPRIGIIPATLFGRMTQAWSQPWKAPFHSLTEIQTNISLLEFTTHPPNNQCITPHDYAHWHIAQDTPAARSKFFTSLSLDLNPSKQTEAAQLSGLTREGEWYCLW